MYPSVPYSLSWIDGGSLQCVLCAQHLGVIYLSREITELLCPSTYTPRSASCHFLKWNRSGQGTAQKPSVCTIGGTCKQGQSVSLSQARLLGFQHTAWSRRLIAPKS